MRTLTTTLIISVVVIVSAFATKVSAATDGKQLAATYCGSCHVQPAPEHLDKSTWLVKVFPQMRSYMGLDPLPEPQNMLHDVRAMYPTEPMLSENDWYKIAQYYVDNAPDVLPPIPPVHEGAYKPPFTILPILAPHIMPVTTLVKFIPEKRQIVVGDGTDNVVRVYSLDQKLLHTIQLVGPPSSISIVDSTWYITDMGVLYPHDSAGGAVVEVAWRNGVPTTKRVLQQLRRPTYVQCEDIDDDKIKDLLVCEYGNILGRFGLYKKHKNGSYKYVELLNLPGAIRTEILDINGDGKKDIVAQMAQAREGIFAWIQTKKGKFIMKELWTFPPSFGSSSFRIQDYNADGILDLIITCGDNGDYDQPPYKPYQGTYFIRGLGKGAFAQDTFIPMYGAYGAVVSDFEKSGSLGMVSFSFFANYSTSGINVLRYTKDVLKAESTSVELDSSFAGRWLTYDVADINSDGVQDVLIGSLVLGPGIVPDALQTMWGSSNVQALLLLSNGQNK